MPWNDDLPTSAAWDIRVANATDSLTDTYRTTYVFSSSASMAQEAGTRVGNQVLNNVRARLIAYETMAKDNLRGRVAEIDSLLNVCTTALTLYGANVTKGVYILNEAKHALLTWLVATANAKKAYLEAIADYVEQPVTSIEELVNRRYTLAAHTGQHEIGLDTGYWIEQTHPAHATVQVSRSLGVLFGQWLREAEGGTTTQHFYVWLECSDRLSTVTDPAMVVEYLKAADLPAFELHVAGGRIQRARSRADRTLVNYDTSGFDEGMAAFVIAPDRKVYSHAHQRGIFHHSTFLAGGKVLCAGLMSVQAGVVRVVTPKSGHYKATIRDFLNGLQILEHARMIPPDVLVDLEFWKNKYVANVPVQNLARVLDGHGRVRLPLQVFREWAATELRGAAGPVAEIAYSLLIRKFHPGLFGVIQREVAKRSTPVVMESAITSSAEWAAAARHVQHPLDATLAMRVVRMMAR